MGQPELEQVPLGSAVVGRCRWRAAAAQAAGAQPNGFTTGIAVGAEDIAGGASGRRTRKVDPAVG
jgi:hypothetical protein